LNGIKGSEKSKSYYKIPKGKGPSTSSQNEFREKYVIAGSNNADCILLWFKVSFIINSFIKSTVSVHPIRWPQFQESGPIHILHYMPVHSSGTFSYIFCKMSDPWVIPTTLLPSFIAY
jgi:hypothetical protein